MTNIKMEIIRAIDLLQEYTPDYERINRENEKFFYHPKKTLGKKKNKS